jgi:hypothetical protein
MAKTENCLKMGKGAKSIALKQITDDTKHIIMLLEILERISYPLFNAVFSFH